jgi:hypothetical protein
VFGLCAGRSLKQGRAGFVMEEFVGKRKGLIYLKKKIKHLERQRHFLKLVD